MLALLVKCAPTSGASSSMAEPRSGFEENKPALVGFFSDG